MKKTCVFITGTNCSGKTTTAKALIEYFGGIKQTTDEMTYCNDSRAVFAGIYKDTRKNGGVDLLCRTDTLADICRRALLTADVVFCEGSFLDTFGQNLLNAIFTAEKQLYVFLYCNPGRLIERNKKRATLRCSEQVLARMVNKQHRVLRSAKKYADIGVRVISFDTEKTRTDVIVSEILKALGV